MVAQDLALLIDRIRVRNGEPQLYGSQLHWDESAGAPIFFPIEDPANVNARRAEVGLGPIEEYAERIESGELPIFRGIELSADDLLRREVIILECAWRSMETATYMALSLPCSSDRMAA